jgi:glycosyltransferase involved in cell wall biosynthesis
MTIPNPIFDEIINEVKSENLKKKKGKFIFHATWPTGGNVALDAVRQLDIEGKEFHALDYFISVDNHQDSFFHNHKSCDRKTVFKHLAESEYFIYPLYTIHKILRKDTFALTVAEAIAMDTIVITYPLGALPENYKDYCVWLDAPPGANLEELQMADLARDEEGLFLHTKNIVDKINYLESNPEIKEQYRNKGKEYILENFNLNTVGKIWDDFITKLMTK